MNDALKAMKTLRDFCRAHNCYEVQCPLERFCYTTIWNEEEMYSLEDAITEGLKDD